jgi:hypothetical protein
MSVNIACSAPNCANSVIGQCTGYQKTCGKYYCREHSSDTLCFDCSSQKAADENAELVYKEYLSLADKLTKESIPIPKFQFQAKNLLKVGGWSLAIGSVFLLGLIFIGILVNIINLEIPQALTALYMLAVFGTFALAGWPVGVIPVVWLIQNNDWKTKERQKALSVKINQIERGKPGFTQFWNAWVKQRNEEQAKRNREALMGALAVAGAITVGVIGAAVNSSIEDSKRAEAEYQARQNVEQAVGDELRRHGL